MKKFAKSVCIITAGTLLLTVGLFFFLMPMNLTIGGVSGLAMSLNEYFPTIPTGVFMIVMDVILYIMAFILVGRSFGALSIYSSTLFSLSTTFLEMTMPNYKPLTDDIFLNLIFGIGISAVGVAIVLNENASTGGSDILAVIIRKYSNIAVGKAMFLCDFFVVLFGMYTFGAHTGMYALLGILMNSLVIDKVIAGFNVKISMMINSIEHEKINDYILDTLGRGTTLYKVMGGYSKKERYVINTIVSRNQYLKIRNEVKAIDPTAFVWISYISEALGEGFTYDSEVSE